MKRLLCIMFAAILLSLVITEDAKAQRIKSFEEYAFSVDTLNNSENLTFAYAGEATGLYDLRWHIKVSNVSGTTAGTANLEIANCTSCTDWATYATWNIATVSDTLISVPSFPGIRARVTVASSGTHVSRVWNYASWIRRNQ